jgi:hypothetical protein
MPLVFLALGVAEARASVTYQYVTDSTSYSAAAGANVTVNVFLQEVLTGSSTSIINFDGGLFGAGFLVSQQTGGGNSTISSAAVSWNTNNATTGAPPGFGTGAQTSTSPATSTQIGGLVNIGSGSISPNTSNISSVNGTTLPNTITNAVFLGSFTVKAGSSTTFALQSYSNFSGVDGNTLTPAGTDLDVSGTAPNGEQYIGADSQSPVYTFTVAAVPEPSSMVLCGLGACGLAWGAYRRRRSLAAKLA